MEWKPGVKARAHNMRLGHPWMDGHEMNLSQGPHLLLDWRYVLPGELGLIGPYWAKTDGEPIPLRLWKLDEWKDREVEAQYIPQDVPFGIKVVCEKAVKSEPFDTGGPPGRIVHSEGIYRTWYTIFEGEQNRGIHYAESTDGLDWEKITPCSIDWSACPGIAGRERATVFVDPIAPEEERYKIFFRGGMPADKAEYQRILDDYMQNRPDDLVPLGDTLEHLSGMWGIVSPDGINWKALPGPLAIHYSDTTNVVCYDEQLKLYVWYCRYNSFYGRRCIGRAETDDFRRWPAPDMLVWPTADNHPTDDLYTNSKTLYPGTIDQHLMFPSLYHHTDDSSELRLYSSPDGIVWSQVPGGAVLEPGEIGEWDSGCIFGGSNLVPLPDDRVGLPYGGYLYPHKYPRNNVSFAHRGAYAVWPKGRLGAYEAEEEGGFTVPPAVFARKRLVLNVRTKHAGCVRVEVSDKKGNALPGRSFEESDPIIGDHLHRTVTWKGEEDLRRKADQPVMLRFRMRAAKLFSFELL